MSWDETRERIRPVAAPSKKQPDQPPEGAGDSIDQAAIDALLAGASDGAAPAETGGGDAGANDPNADDRSGASGAVSQADIDALFQKTAGDAGVPDATDGASSRDDTVTAESSDGISQSDIDALLRSAGAEASGVSGGDAGAAEVPSEPDSRLDSMGRPFDDAAAAMQAAIEEEAAAGRVPTPAPAPPSRGPAAPPEVRPYTLSDLSIPADMTVDPKRVTMLSDVNLRVKIELGRMRMLVEDVLALGEGSVVELDKLAGDPVDVYVNDRLIARGEVLVLNDNFCVRISDVLSADPHRIGI